MGKNNIVIWGHPRSGNMFFTGLIGMNFYSDRDLRSAFPTHDFIDEKGEISDRLKWGQLFGGHTFRPPLNPELIGRSIYIKRSVIDTALSLYNYVKDYLPDAWQSMSFSDFINRPIGGFRYWNLKPVWKFTGLVSTYADFTIDRCILSHHMIWEQTGIYVVQYEDLVRDAEGELLKISQHFGLPLKPPFKLIDRLIGFRPVKGQIGRGYDALEESENGD